MGQVCEGAPSVRFSAAQSWQRRVAGCRRCKEKGGFAGEGRRVARLAPVVGDGGAAVAVKNGKEAVARQLRDLCHMRVRILKGGEEGIKGKGGGECAVVW